MEEQKSFNDSLWSVWNKFKPQLIDSDAPDSSSDGKPTGEEDGTNDGSTAPGANGSASGADSQIPTGAVLPQTISGQLLNQDHTPASNVFIVIRRPEYPSKSMRNFKPTSNVPWPKPSTLTNERGGFLLALPSFPLPDRMFFDVYAKDQPVVAFSVCARELLDGLLGPIVLKAQLNPFSDAEAKTFRSFSGFSMFEQFHRTIESSSDSQEFRIGDTDCAQQSYDQQIPLQEFPFYILFRLIEPEVVSLNPSLPLKPPPQATPSTGQQIALPIPGSAASNSATTTGTGQVGATVGGVPPPVGASTGAATGAGTGVLGTAAIAAVAASLVAGGGAAANDPNSQFLADILGTVLALVPQGQLIAKLEPGLVSTIVSGLIKTGKLSLDNLRNAITGVQQASPELKTTPSKRKQISAPLDITLFKNQVNGLVDQPVDLQVPGTLGLGYMLQCKQVWRQGKLALGDLLYSMPLAPDEEQLIAVREIQRSSSLMDQESTSSSDRQQFSSADDSSTNAVFAAAFNEAANQSSKYDAKSSTSGSGGSGGVAIPFLGSIGSSGSSSETNTSGSFSAAQNLNRNYASGAAQNLSSSVSRSAAAVRSANRTQVRLATASEKQNVVTKRIKNNNHCHALTIQFWEVLRQVSIATEVAGLQLVCLIPLDLITFITGEANILTDLTLTPAAITNRYHSLIDNLDAIATNTPDAHPYNTAIRLLRLLQFTLKTTSPIPNDSRTLTIKVSGNFLPNESISVSIPYGPSTPLTVTLTPPQSPGLQQPSSVAQYAESLRQARTASAPINLSATVQLPPNVNYNQLGTPTFTVSQPAFPWNINIQPVLPSGTTIAPQSLQDIQAYVHSLSQPIKSADLPDLQPATISSAGITANINDSEWPLTIQQGFPKQLASLSGSFTLLFSTDSLPTVWSPEDLAAVESLYRHVLANRVSYSKAVWNSLSRDEWALLLAGYCLELTNRDPDASAAVPTSASIPLLSCISTQPLGFEGNLAIFPMVLPVEETDADGMPLADGLSNSNLTDTLLNLQMLSFRSVPAAITLPTQGMLGEAVLGTCNSCEKIDLTRFWNWSDSPSASNAPAISGVGLATSDSLGWGPSTASGSGSGGPPQPTITINTGDSPSATPILSSLVPPASSLIDSKIALNPTIQALQTLVSQTESRASDQAKNAMQTSADQSKNAMQASKELTEKAMDTFKDLAQTAAKAAPAAAALA